MVLTSELSLLVMSREADRLVVTDEQMRRFEGYMAEIFDALRMDHSPATIDTPRRFLRSLVDATAGYDGDPKLMTVFDSEYGDGLADRPNQVIEGPIRFHALCEHHALPFFGEAYVGYIPGDRILGISKLVRLVRVFARRFTLQERLGQQVAETLEEMIAPRGVAVYLEANHLCTQMRGVQEASPLTRTTCWRGRSATTRRCVRSSSTRVGVVGDTRFRGRSRTYSRRGRACPGPFSWLTMDGVLRFNVTPSLSIGRIRSVSDGQPVGRPRAKRGPCARPSAANAAVRTILPRFET